MRFIPKETDNETPSSHSRFLVVVVKIETVRQHFHHPGVLILLLEVSASLADILNQRQLTQLSNIGASVNRTNGHIANSFFVLTAFSFS